mmetsp:Transcript_157135/g.277477  ORF Transcript_157135/g.277477 Transcript_157135/m.277477 type:complete len:104 (-) Transcript_157135:53-364(-)
MSYRCTMRLRALIIAAFAALTVTLLSGCGGCTYTLADGEECEAEISNKCCNSRKDKGLQTELDIQDSACSADDLVETVKVHIAAAQKQCVDDYTGKTDDDTMA